MKEAITVYVRVKASENLPIGTATAKKGEFTGQLQIRKDGAYFYYENTILDYEFSDPRLYEFEWLKPQELITFTKEEWSEVRNVIEGARVALPVLENILNVTGLKLGKDVARKMIDAISKLNNL